MKYKRFRWLLGGMFLALAGIISLQVYWLGKAAENERRKFSEEVRAAMGDATAQLESGEAFSLISDAMLPEIHEQENVFIRDTIVTGDGKKHVRIFRKYGSDSLSVGPLSPPVPPEPPMPPDAPEPGIVIRYDSLPGGKDKMTISLLEKADRMKSAVKEAWVQYLNLSGKASDRVSQKQIGEALRRSFLRHGISEPFSFGVYDSLSRKFEFNADAKTQQLLGKEAYAVPLFPNDMHPGRSELRVSLDVSDSRVYRALWLELLTAFMLTSVLVLVFYFTFREALRQKKISEIRNDFINNMTHELKTPIATISLAADTMTNPLVIADADKVRHYAELIRRENRRMNDQVEKVLELALAERNELKMLKEPVDPSELLSHTVSTMSLQAAAKNGTIRYEAEPGLPTIQADPFHLERAFTNLIDNALKYSADKPQIFIRAALVNGMISVGVTDHGIGIAPADQSRIFDQFYRVSTGNRHDVKGFGLGLSYVKTIVEKHGGAVTVKSQPGKGSTFTVLLPV